MALAEDYTLLSLDRYARILGIDPVRFSGAGEIQLATGAKLFPLLNDVNRIWPQNAWQSTDHVGRNDLAREIKRAESEIAKFLGYWPGPVWVSQEMHPYPKFFNPQGIGGGVGVDGKYKQVKAGYAKFIQGGRRAVTVVQAGQAVVYTDPDADGFDELATITADVTGYTDACTLKIYVAGKSGAQQWELREPIAKSITGTTLTVTFRPWQLIDPDVLNAFPTDEPSNSGMGIDVSDSGNLLSTVDIYYEYTNTIQAQALFYFENYPVGLGSFPASLACTCCDGTGCQACIQNTQNGCLTWRDVDSGLIVPIPASYDADAAKWYEQNWTCNREPDSVKLWYYAGAVSEDYRAGASCSPLTGDFERAIAFLATARLNYEYPANNNVMAFVRGLNTDVTRVVNDGDSYSNAIDVMECPFGTRKGEIEAWRILRRFNDRVDTFIGLVR